MNTAQNDLTLFEKYVADGSVLEESMLSLADTATGQTILDRMADICQYVAQNFNPDQDPLWPKHGNQFVCDLFEARHIGNDDFILVWRDVAFAYYKRFGRSNYISRPLSEDEVTQYFIELRGALHARMCANPKEDPLKAYKATPYVEPTDAKGIQEKAEADALIAFLDAREGYYTLNERRTLMAERNGYSPTLRPLPNVSAVNGLLEVLRSEEIPEKRPSEETLCK